MVRAARIRTPNRQIRSLVLCVDLVGSRPIWPAQVGGVVVQTAPDGSRRIVWMIKQMIKEPSNRRSDAVTVASRRRLDRSWCGVPLT
jgi:hypothetical protein